MSMVYGGADGGESAPFHSQRRWQCISANGAIAGYPPTFL